MSNSVGMAAQLAGQSLRFGWYLALNRLVEWRTSQLGLTRRYKPSRPVPSTQELLADQAQLLLSDALAVRDGLYPPMDDEAASPLGHLFRVRRMLADLPVAARRRAADDATTAKAEAAATGVPDYYAQDFHYQTGGYLSEDSARLYDVQVETLFMGAAAPMRRTALRPIAEFMHGRDQRQITLLDVACGTGRFLRQVRLAYPAMRLTGLDLSRTYLDEARRHLEPLRGAELIEAPAERTPLPNASVDIVSSIFLYHELPPAVRRQVTGEIARVLKSWRAVRLPRQPADGRPAQLGRPARSLPHALPRALLPQLCHRRPRRHVRGRRACAPFHVDPLSVEAAGAPQERGSVMRR